MTLKEFVALTTIIVETKGRNSMEDLHVYLANGDEVTGISFVERAGGKAPQYPSVMVY